MQNEMKQVSETVYKNGTFIATERSCTWLHRITTDGKTGNGLDQAGFVFVLKELQHTTCLDTSTNQKYTKNMKKSRHSATHWKQGVTVYLFFFFLKCFPFFSFFNNFFFSFLMLQLCVQSQKFSPLRPTTKKKTKTKNKQKKLPYSFISVTHGKITSFK